MDSVRWGGTPSCRHATGDEDVWSGSSFGRVVGASVASVVCVDLLLLPQLWPMEIDGWLLSMVRAAAFGAGGLGALGGGLALTSWSNSWPVA